METLVVAVGAVAGEFINFVGLRQFWRVFD